MNIVEPILFQARYQPEAPALCAQGIDVITYAQLAIQMNNVARRAMACGLKRGDVVILSLEQPLLHAAIILGLTQIGVIPVSVAGHKAPDGLKIDAVISTAPYPFSPVAPRLPPDYSWIMGDGATVAMSPAGSEARAEICRIILTSGTMGVPKAVALTHGLAAARGARFDYLLGSRHATTSRLYMNMGLAAAPGYYFLASILGRGGTIFFSGETLDNTLRAFEIFKIQSMLASPASLIQMLKFCDQHPSIELHVDTIISTGMFVSQDLLARVRPRLCTHLVTRYSSTETSTAATASAARIAHVAGAAGYVAPGVTVQIVDQTDQCVATGKEGIVRIASEVSVDRYIDDPVESAQVFRKGWFYPGDIGSLTADNLLIISGRQNNVLNAGGGKMAAEKIEATLGSCKGVSEAAVFMATSALGVEEVWAAVVCSEKLDPESLRAHCRTRMPAVFVPAHIVAVEALPINELGKVDRARLKEMIVRASGQ